MRKFIVLFSVMVAFFAVGCAETRYISKPNSPLSELGLKASTDNVELTLHHIIISDGPGSWVKKAGWTEWKVTLKNATPVDVSISEMSLVDPRGIYVGSQYATIASLESESAMLAKGYKDWFASSAGSTAIATVGSNVAAQAAISTGSMIPIYGLSYLSTLPSLLTPYLEAKDRDAIEAEFHRRQLPSPLKLSGGASVTGSIFFPVVPQPKALVIGYRKSENEKPSQIKLPLTNQALDQKAERIHLPKPEALSEPLPKPEAAPTTSSLAPKEAQAAIAPSSPPPAKPLIAYLVVIKTVNVRTEANVKSKIITTIKKGEKVEKLGKSGNWFNVKLPSGETGWIFKDYVKEAE